MCSRRLTIYNNRFLFVLPVPSAAPTVGEIIRTSATEIQVQWSALSSDNTEAATYLVRYRPLQSVQKRNADDLSTIVETNRTSFVISELDPRFAYAVSVAARNRGGVGNYSQEVTIECELLYWEPPRLEGVFFVQCLTAAYSRYTTLEP